MTTEAWHSPSAAPKRPPWPSSPPLLLLRQPRPNPETRPDPERTDVCRTMSIVPPTAPMDASTYAISTRFQPQSEDNHSRHRPDRRQTDRSRGTTAGSRLWCHQGSCRPSREKPRPLVVEQHRPRDPPGSSLQRLPARTAHIGGDPPRTHGVHEDSGAGQLSASTRVRAFSAGLLH
jgi:hypothetical protein